MEIVFYIAAIVAIASTIMAISRLNPVHALLYLILSLLSVAIIFYVLGAPFVAAYLRTNPLSLQGDCLLTRGIKAHHGGTEKRARGTKQF